MLERLSCSWHYVTAHLVASIAVSSVAVTPAAPAASETPGVRLTKRSCHALSQRHGNRSIRCARRCAGKHLPGRHGGCGGPL